MLSYVRSIWANQKDGGDKVNGQRNLSIGQIGSITAPQPHKKSKNVFNDWCKHYGPLFPLPPPTPYQELGH